MPQPWTAERCESLRDAMRRGDFREDAIERELQQAMENRATSNEAEGNAVVHNAVPERPAVMETVAARAASESSRHFI